MIDVPVSAWGWMLSAMVVSSGAGLALSRLVPWTDPARQAGIPRAFALAIAPFLLGLMAVVALGVFRGASHAVHLGVVFAGLLALGFAAAFAHSGDRPVPAASHDPMGLWEWVFGGILAIWAVLLIVDALFMPLMQNDALEYATVSRLLFEQKDLLAYPALDPAKGTSGFYGPWTHPPLYPALIYIVSVFQGHADAPGLMRLISPWCALAATGVVYSIGCLENRLTGLLSALIFLSTPLLFLGAGSALIDPLPILGMTLVLCTVTLVEGSPARQGAVQGATLGIALWTHSQAVLFVPLALVAILVNNGWRNVRAFMQQTALLLGVAWIAAVFPYYRNFMLFGSCISDTPAVFALEKLGWAEYFSKVRSLATWSEKIQYGILKGWFAIEAYSWAFWLMLPGVAFCMNRGSRLHLRKILLTGNTDGIPDRWKLVMLGVILCYLCGVVLSALIGIDLMIRNERYLLILMPCVAWFAGIGIRQILSWAGAAERANAPGRHFPRRWMAFTFAFLVLLAGVAQLIVVGGHRWKTLQLSPEDISRSHEEKLRKWPAFNTVEYLKQCTPQDATILSLKPADMYYTGRRMISYLDPRLLPFYDDRDVATAYQRLRSLGVHYIHIPDYSLPPLYNSALQAILARSDLTRLVYAAGGNQIYMLLPGGPPGSEHTQYVFSGNIPWIQISQLTLGGRKGLLRLPASSRALNQGESSAPDFFLPIFYREMSTVLISAPQSLSKEGDTGDVSERNAAGEYRLDLAMEGDAYVNIYLRMLSKEESPLGEFLLGEIAVNPMAAERRFTRRFTVQPDVGAVSIMVEHRGKTEIRIVRATMVSVK